MMLPNFQEMMLPALRAVCKRESAKVADIENDVANTLNLTAEQRRETVPSGRQTTLHNRTHWAVYDLYRAGLLEKARRGIYTATAEGRKLLKQSPEKLDREYLKRYPSFCAFLENSRPQKTEAHEISSLSLNEADPETQLYNAVGDLSEKLKTDLLDELKHADPVYFEKIILDLFKAMNYGNGETTPKSHDGGVDGIICEDALGLSKIYMQAKRYADNKVNEKEIQNFVGALGCSEVTKGVFITTSFFDEKAKRKALDAAKKNMIIRLIDGDELAKLMIEHNVGVKTKETIRIKAVDMDYFRPEEE